jgi:hypothetical protein
LLWFFGVKAMGSTFSRVDFGAFFPGVGRQQAILGTSTKGAVSGIANFPPPKSGIRMITV